MKSLVLLIGDGALPPWSEHTDDQQAQVIEQFETFAATCAQREGVTILAGEALGSPDTATVLRTRSGQVALSEGPYAEAVEHLGGFYLIEAPDLDVLVELLGLLPAYDMQITPAVDPV